MKKLKFLSKLLAVFVIVPAILLCTACGGGQLAQEAKVDTSGNWDKATVVSLEDFTEFSADIDEEDAKLGKGFHLTTNMSAFGARMYTNAYFVAGETAEENQIALKYEVETPEDEDEEAMKMAYTMYLKDNHLYLEGVDFAPFVGLERDDMVYNMDVDLDSKYESVNPALTGTLGYLSSIMEGITEQSSFSVALEMFDEYAGGNDIVIKKIEKGSTVRYQITIDADNLESEFGEVEIQKAEMYLIFKDGAFNGAAYSLVGEVTVDGETETVVNEFAITSFEGKVDFPKFDEYMGFADVAGDVAKKMVEEQIG